MKLNKILILICFFTILLTILAYGQNDYLIQPGISVGNAYVGRISITDTKKWLGSPENETVTKSKYVLFYDEKYGFTLFFDKNTRMLYTIVVSSSIYYTNLGIKVGSDIDAVKKAYYNGIMDGETNSYYCNKDGIIFGFDSYNRVKTITVYNLQYGM